MPLNSCTTASGRATPQIAAAVIPALVSVGWKTVCFIFWIGFNKVLCRHMRVMRCFYFAKPLVPWESCRRLRRARVERCSKRFQVEQEEHSASSKLCTKTWFQVIHKTPLLALGVFAPIYHNLAAAPPAGSGSACFSTSQMRPASLQDTRLFSQCVKFSRN